ncbi:type II toxin-antitoxin system death-on-curing family toxin [Limosilactobacillus ingluviei]|uniref:type II toxin-antitoxin system death-on-curing family toxin n=1 Tax=Limosilactobacillus ingluviei TaxID=148604 RepID=UPI00195EE9DE|nr:type II toxin-antitoxin system death-on-curing family toxin [Limosilactobacillus ingluviei]MBM6728325.1 type II toxin-antitoxin system death-on-curing family toxin [Limosilactobacillus ingluviei]
MKYLTPSDLIETNRLVLNNENQAYAGVQYEEGLSMISEQPQLIVFGQELYPTIWLKAAFIMQKITKKHIFADGNKRTALLATLYFLDKNGYEMILSTEEKKQLVLSVTLADDSKEEMIKLSRSLQRGCRNKYGF